MTIDGTGPLRVAVVHSYYSSRQPSGENVVVDLQVEALRRAGHHVELIARFTDELERSRTYPVRAGLRAATGRGDSALAEVRAARPDLVHIHNLFPNLGRTWVEQLDVPMVTTLHNYRPICPAGTLFRDGHPCTLCPDEQAAHHAVVHRCFKGSRVQTLPVASGTRFSRDPVLRRARRVITLNDDMQATYVRYGVPAERTVTIPNFVPRPSVEVCGRREGWLFVGRLSHDKGIVELLRQWPHDQRLTIVGAGPQEDEVVGLAGPGVTVLGNRPHDEVGELMARARGLVFPSLWPEGLPTVYLEGLAAGLPVLAWPQSIVGTLVDRDATGIVHRGDLADELLRAESEFANLSDHCRAVFDRLYSEESWAAAITQEYQAVVDAS